jgi:hypothetical protein
MLDVHVGHITEHKTGNDVQTDCWYTGRVIGDDTSLVSLSTCTHEVPSQQSLSSFKLNSLHTESLTLHAFVSAFGSQVSWITIFFPPSLSM